MAAGESGTVTLSGRTYLVTITSDTPRVTRFLVSCTDNPARDWRPGEVRVGIESRFACITCMPHPGEPCLHIVLAQKFMAAQPVAPAAPSTRDAMLEALRGPASADR